MEVHQTQKEVEKDSKQVKSSKDIPDSTPSANSEMPDEIQNNISLPTTSKAKVSIYQTADASTIQDNNALQLKQGKVSWSTSSTYGNSDKAQTSEEEPKQPQLKSRDIPANETIAGAVLKSISPIRNSTTEEKYENANTDPATLSGHLKNNQTGEVSHIHYYGRPSNRAYENLILDSHYMVRHYETILTTFVALCFFLIAIIAALAFR